MKYLAFLSLLLITIGCNTNKKQENIQATTPSSSAPADTSIKLPAGFSAVVFADTVGSARHLVVNSNGDVFVKLVMAVSLGVFARFWQCSGAVPGLQCGSPPCAVGRRAGL